MNGERSKEVERDKRKHDQEGLLIGLAKLNAKGGDLLRHQARPHYGDTDYARAEQIEAGFPGLPPSAGR